MKSIKPDISFPEYNKIKGSEILEKKGLLVKTPTTGRV